MPAAYSTMTISDDLTTCDLSDGTNFQLLERSYAPTVAARRHMNMAGRGPVLPALERITVTIRGETGAAALANVAKLTELLDRAERWTAGDQIAPVLFAIQPQGSLLDEPLQAVILGRPDNAPGISLPATFNDKLMIYEIGPVEIQFVWFGLLIDEAESGVTAAAAANPTVREATFADSAAIPSPVTVRITGWSDTEHLNIEAPSILIIAAEKEDIYLIQAEGLTATNWTSVADSANDASGGNILRYTAPDTDEHNSGSHTVVEASFNADTEEVAIFAMLKGHASKDFILQAETASYVFNSSQRTPLFVVEAGTYATPTPVYLGSVSQRRGHGFVRLVARALDSAGSPTLNIDYLVLVALKSTTYIIQLGEMFLSSPFISESPSNVRILVDPAPLTELSPFIGYEEISGEVFNPSQADVEYQGDGSIFMPGPTIASLWIGKRGNSWVDVDAGGDPTLVGMSAVRAKGYLSPQ